ncbi:hypothetical protein LCGC14_1067180 [marine sediment metagenome]|uniref:PDZ domain-containing protein n=1 Tax=marine sediment metagenome TaxID=412755 RepID=A0A0F9Q2E5_9ZZZZ|nr:S41 family peptidase [Actinomycetota bacterium]
MKKRTITAVIFLVFLLMTGTFSGGFLYSSYIHQQSDKTSAKSFDFSLLKEALSHIDETFYDDVSKSKVLDGAINGIMEALDNPYASYYPPKEFKHFKTSMAGNYSGVGIVIGGKKGQIKVLKVFESSPAKSKGLLKGEAIIAIDGKSAKKLDTEQASELIKGPEGTTVTLTLEKNKKKRDVAIKRAKITFPNISSKTFGDIGYVSMHFFNNEATKNLSKEIRALEKKNIRSLILDLRNNPGGQLDEAIDVSSLFIDKGVIVKTKNKDKEETVYSATGNKIFDNKIVVLISENSASASEIVAGAIQDRHRGTIVGVKSFGKGTVQQVVSLSNGGALVIPNEKWLTPNGRDITKKGITPDVKIKAGKGKVDTQLEKAKSLLK